jgi:selenocysteine lyase/cysteine desulfurase
VGLLGPGLARNRVPTVPGGGTIAFVDPVGHRYLDDPVAREDGGTPAIVESVRAGLVVALKQAVGTDLIHEREQRFLGRALARRRRNPNLELLGTWRSRGCRSSPSGSATATATCTTSRWWRC